MKVALLVKDAVVGQEYLVVNVHHIAVMTKSGCVGYLWTNVSQCFFRWPIQRDNVHIAQNHCDAL